MESHISIIGRLVATPELKTVVDKNGQEVIYLPMTVAVNDKLVSKEAAYYNVTIWSTHASALAPYLNKGDVVAVSGHLLAEINISNNKVYQNLVIKRAEITLLSNGKKEQQQSVSVEDGTKLEIAKPGETPEPAATAVSTKKTAPTSDEQIPW